MNYRQFSKLVRAAANQSGSSYPIDIIEGDQPPKLTGSGWHYENASGDLIRYPCAYRKAYGKPIYISSSKAITVGRNWLFNNGIDKTVLDLIGK